MQVEYENKSEDVEAWWRFYAERDTTHRLNFWALILVVASFCAWVATRLASDLWSQIGLGALGFLLGSLLAACPVARFDSTRQLPAPPLLRRDWRTSGLTGLTVEAEGVVEEGPAEAHKHSWSAIDGLAPAGLDAGTASQLIPGVRRTAVGAEKAGRGRISLWVRPRLS